MTLFVFIITLLFISLTYQFCDINVNLIERSDKKISRLIKLKNFNSRKEVKIKHFNCMEQKVRVSSLKKRKNEYILIDRKEAFLDGIGNITYKIQDDGKILITQRIGIICLFGDCGNASG